MRYFLELSYNGAPFHGWQIQPNAISVQETIEKALSTLLRCPVNITGAGRTDTGVNAAQMFAHFDSLKDDLQDNPDFLKSLNTLSGKDIFIKRCFQVADDAHARFDAKSRTYKYLISSDKNPFIHNFLWKSPDNLNFDAMNEAAETLISTSDFTSFAKLHSDNKTNICKVTEALWTPMDVREPFFYFENINPKSESYVFTITADRFLRNMVRSIVGTLIDVGRGKLSLSNFTDVVNAKNRCAAGTSMPAHPLFLWEIKY